MISDVTELLRVDTDLADGDTVDRAVALLREGMPCAVDSYETAERVLVAYGVDPKIAKSRVDFSRAVV